MKIVAGEGTERAKFWASPPFRPHRLGPHRPPLEKSQFLVWPDLVWPNLVLAKVGDAPQNSPQDGLASRLDHDKMEVTLVDWERGIVRCVLIQHL